MRKRANERQGGIEQEKKRKEGEREREREGGGEERGKGSHQPNNTLAEALNGTQHPASGMAYIKDMLIQINYVTTQRWSCQELPLKMPVRSKHSCAGKNRALKQQSVALKKYGTTIW